MKFSLVDVVVLYHVIITECVFNHEQPPVDRPEALERSRRDPLERIILGQCLRSIVSSSKNLQRQVFLLRLCQTLCCHSYCLVSLKIFRVSTVNILAGASSKT